VFAPIARPSLSETPEFSAATYLEAPWQEVARVDVSDGDEQGLGAAKNAVRMARIAKFYEKLPKGPAPERAPSGPLGWYQAKYFGKNPSAARTCPHSG
jgi:hypothetical protein